MLVGKGEEGPAGGAIFTLGRPRWNLEEGRDKKAAERKRTVTEIGEGV